MPIKLDSDENQPQATAEAALSAGRAPLTTNAHVVLPVPDFFKSICRDGVPTQFSNGGFLPRLAHVQGICENDKYFFLTQDDGSIMVVSQTPDQNGNLPLVNTVSTAYNHAGGCQRIGDYMVIGTSDVEGVFKQTWKNSRIELYSLSGKPAFVNTLASFPGGCTGAGIADFTLPKGDTKLQWVLATLSTSYVTIYRSKGVLGQSGCTFDADGYFTAPLLDGAGKPVTDAQSINLVTDASPNQYVWLIAFVSHGTSAFEDHALLYRVHLGAEGPDAHSFQFFQDIQVNTNGSVLGAFDVHFRYGAGITYTPLGVNNLSTTSLLATQRGFVGGKLTINEFVGQ